jgi:hypothetical protein
MEEAKIWLVFLGCMALLIGAALAVVAIIVGWLLGISDYYEKKDFICAVIAIIIPPYGVFNGLMFVVKKHCGLECCSNYEVFHGVAECISLAIRTKKSS